MVWGPTLAAADSVARADLRDLGDVVRVGVLAGHDRRLAAWFRGPAHCPPRVRAPGARRRRHPRGAQQLLPPNPRLPAGFVDHPRIRSSPRRVVDVRLAGPHRPQRRCVGRTAVPAGGVECGCRDHRRGARRRRRGNRPPCGPVRGRRADGDLGGRFGRRLFRGRCRMGYRPSGAWRHGRRCEYRCWSQAVPGCCWAGHCSSTTASH